MSRHTKFVTALLGVSAVTLLLLVNVVKKSFSITTSQVAEPLIAADVTDIPIDSTEPLLGNPGAATTVIAFIDFGDFSNRSTYATLVSFVRAHPRDVRLVVKHAPFASFFFASTHRVIHEALLCASQTGNFWRYADNLATIPTLWRLGQLTTAAESLNIPAVVLKSCLDNPLTGQSIDAISNVNKIFSPESPTIYVNNKRLHLTKDVSLETLLNSFIAATP